MHKAKLFFAEGGEDHRPRPRSREFKDLGKAIGQGICLHLLVYYMPTRCAGDRL